MTDRKKICQVIESLQNIFKKNMITDKLYVSWIALSWISLSINNFEIIFSSFFVNDIHV